ncbi:MAG: acetylglutamate kinase [Candidatus Margulisiibacteriota bacterium]|jgi:acetylglutamate kinase
MQEEAIAKARVLIEALPYITRFQGQIIVLKYGGSAMLNDPITAAVAQDISLLKYVGLEPVVVHGGGKEITKWLERIGKKAEFVDGLRVTDKETMEVTEMVLIGKVKKDIMHNITKFGGKCVGLTGKDDQLMMAKQKKESLGFVGEITKINNKLIKNLIEDGYIPVISPIGVDENGTTYNINADTAAAAIAGSLQAEKFVLLTDVAGVLDKTKKLIQKVKLEEIDNLIADGTITGGMIPKIECCRAAMNQNVKSAHIIDGRIEHSILLEIFTDQGIGSMVIK